MRREVAKSLAAAIETEQERRSQQEFDNALIETNAQAQILKVLAPLKPSKRKDVMRAVQMLLEAERLVPGVIQAFRSGSPEPKE